jgi:hypothetical protein
MVCSVLQMFCAFDFMVEHCKEMVVDCGVCSSNMLVDQNNQQQSC